MLPEMSRRAIGQTIGMRTKMAKQKGLNAGNSFFACLRRCEHVVTHCNFASAEQVSKMEFGVCELPERGSDYAAGGVRPETDNDEAEWSRGMQHDGMRLNLGRTLYRQRLR
jgi:hypothetical protein